MKLGIIGAMDVEVATLKGIMENKTEQEVAGSVYCEGTLEGIYNLLQAKILLNFLTNHQYFEYLKNPLSQTELFLQSFHRY